MPNGRAPPIPTASPKSVCGVSPDTRTVLQLHTRNERNMNPKQSPLLLRAISAAACGSPGIIRRARTLDHAMVVADGGAQLPINTFGDARGFLLGYPFRTHDADSRPLKVNGQEMARTVDSTGAFLVGELERLDQTLHLPLS